VATKFNGVPYIVQRAAAAVFSDAGRKQTAEQVAHYMENARLIREGLQAAERAHIVGTPAAGFGASGKGYFRISAFNSRENVEEAIARIQGCFGS